MPVSSLTQTSTLSNGMISPFPGKNIIWLLFLILLKVAIWEVWWYQRLLESHVEIVHFSERQQDPQHSAAYYRFHAYRPFSWRGDVVRITPTLTPPQHPSHRYYNLPLPLRFGPQRFQEALKLAQRVGESYIDWKKFKYMVFDAPKFQGTYEERYNYMGKYLF